MENKELILDKNTKINNIVNPESYTKLVIKSEISQKLLNRIINKLINIKELTIESETCTSKNSIEQNISNYIFKEKLEKLTFNNITSFGYKEIRKRDRWIKDEYYKLETPSLKSIIFIISKSSMYIQSSYFEECSNLEEITYVLNEEFDQVYSVDFNNTNLKKINIQYLDKEYNVDLDYLPNSVSIDSKGNCKKIIITLKAFEINTKITIDTITDEITRTSELFRLNDTFIENNVLTIPDYVTDIDYDNIDYRNAIKHIKFNSKLFENIKNQTYIADSEYYQVIESITIVNNDEMSLFPEKVIDIKKYGKIKSLYIKDYKLNIGFENKKLLVTKDEIIEEKLEEIILDPSKEQVDLDLNKYSITELEEYLYYRKLSELIRNNCDKELNDAMEVVEDRVIKRLTKSR